VNKPTRPFRNYSVYAAACVDCGEEVESRELPVPLRCAKCQIKRDKGILKDRPAPVRSTSGA
jgi:DNA-directed RNA polymerase subunit RPC12/RpoP